MGIGAPGLLHHRRGRHRCCAENAKPSDRWSPDKASLKRGAGPETWNLADLRLTLLGKRLDITGLHFYEYRIATRERTIGRFAVTRASGTLPAATAFEQS